MTIKESSRLSTANMVDKIERLELRKRFLELQEAVECLEARTARRVAFNEAQEAKQKAIAEIKAKYEAERAKRLEALKAVADTQKAKEAATSAADVKGFGKPKAEDLEKVVKEIETLFKMIFK